MTQDPRDVRRLGGAEYAPGYDPQPSVRPVPQPVSPRLQASLDKIIPEEWRQQAREIVAQEMAQAAQAQTLPAPPPPPAQATTAPVQVAPPALSTSGPNTVKLSRAYKAHDVDVQVVTFRKYTVKELRKVGYPLRNVFGPDGMPAGLDELPDVVARYMSVLSEPPLPPSTIDAMDVDDFALCSRAILLFFV